MCHHISNAVRRNLVSARVLSHFKRSLRVLAIKHKEESALLQFRTTIRVIWRYTDALFNDISVTYQETAELGRKEGCPEVNVFLISFLKRRNSEQRI